MKGYLCPYFSFLEIEVLMADHKERERALSWGSVLKDAHFVLFHEAISKDFNLNLRKKIRTEQITDGIKWMNVINHKIDPEGHNVHHQEMPSSFSFEIILSFNNQM